MAASILILTPAGLRAAGEPGRAPSDLGVYHTYIEMISELQNLTAAHPDITKLVALRQTYENRTIWAVKLSDNVSVEEAEPNITILGGIHARELIGVEVPLYILEYLVNNYSSNASIRRLIDGTQMWFLPMLNPDGHVFVEQSGDWRKNRRPYPGGIGVDLNRNFGHLWGIEASHDASAEDYCGPGPFSENETQAVRDLATVHPMAAAVSYHSGAAAILYPWGNSEDQSSVDPRLPSLALNMSLAMPEGRRYTPMMARGLYTATGDTDDYFYANLSMLPFTVELSAAYRPPETQVAQICADNLPAAVRLIDYCIPRHAITLLGDAESFSAPPGKEAAINFTVANIGDAGEQASLSASCNLSWNFSLSPERLTVPKGGSASFRLTVTVPEGAPAFLRCGVAVRAACDSGAEAVAILFGTAEQVHRLGLSVSAPAEVSPDTTVAVNVTIVNLGNGRESLSLAAGARNDWALAPPPLPFLLNLSAGESNNTTLNLIVPPDALAGPTGLIYFRATTADGRYQANDSRAITVLPRRDLRLLVGEDRLTLREGQMRNITLEFQNRGNLWENGTLNLSGDYRWGTLDSVSLNIPPFSNRTARLSVQGRRPGGNLTASFMSLSEGPGARENFTVVVLANATVNATNVTQPANAVLVIILAAIILVAVMAFVFWDIGRHDEAERARRHRYERLAARRPGRDPHRTPPAKKVAGKGP